ncbi:TPA: BC1881 family protein [Bacillus cereus]|nr:hypothetical protein TU58_30095 [Bacillus cereus]
MASKYMDTKKLSKELSKRERVTTICVEAYEKIEVVGGWPRNDSHLLRVTNNCKKKGCLVKVS